MSLRTAIRRATVRRRTTRRFAPVDQVLRSPLRPLVQHVDHHHQHHHFTSTALRLQVTVPVRVVSTTHPIHVHVVPGGTTATPVGPSTAYPGVVLHTPSPVAAGAAGHLAPIAVSPVDGHGPRAAARALTRRPLPARQGPPRVELVHRHPTPSAEGAVGDWPAGARANPAAPRPAWGPAAASTATVAPGAAPLTDADVPRVVDHVVRELDRRVVASRERRGWTT